MLFANLISGNADPAIELIVRWLSAETGIDAGAARGVAWQVLLDGLMAGGTDAAWMCGLLFGRQARANPGSLEVLAVPVLRGIRYGREPVYFSDMIVRADSPLREFNDLRGSRLAYNDLGSYSGFAAVRNELALRYEYTDFFGEMVETGSHLASIAMVLDGGADVAAIDSTVLDVEALVKQAQRRELRIVHVIGPSPMMPWVISTRVPKAERDAVRQALLDMADIRTGKDALVRTHLGGFVAVHEGVYQAMRHVSDDAVTRVRMSPDDPLAAA